MTDNLVPGVMHCAKCNFRLVRNNLYVRSGTVGPGGNETEPCPNGCGPLWPVTWEQEAREMWERATEALNEAVTLRASLERAEKRADAAEGRAKILEDYATPRHVCAAITSRSGSADGA